MARFVGETAKRQSITNPENTVYSAKRFMGRRFEDTDLKKEISSMINMKHIFISSVTNDGLDNLKDKIWQLLNNNDD